MTVVKTGDDPQRVLDQAMKAMDYDAVSKKIAEEFLEVLKSHLWVRLASFDAGDEARKKWPFFQDMAKCLTEYAECLEVVQVSQGEWKVAVNEEKLKSFGLPHDLPELLEYGDPVSLLQALPHWTPAEAEMQDRVSKLVRGMIPT